MHLPFLELSILYARCVDCFALKLHDHGEVWVSFGEGWQYLMQTTLEIFLFKF